MGMAYSKAWTILRAAETGLGFKLLNSTTGGKHGGGATLTPEAEAILAAYERYCANVRQYAAQLSRRISANFCAERRCADMRPSCRIRSALSRRNPKYIRFSTVRRKHTACKPSVFKVEYRCAWNARKGVTLP